MNMEDTQDYLNDSKSFAEEEGHKAFIGKLMAKWGTEYSAKNNTEAFTVRFETSTIKRLDYVCSQLGISRQKFIHDVTIEVLNSEQLKPLY